MEDLTDEIITQVNSKILSFSGIYVAQSQHTLLLDFIKKEAAVRGISPKEVVQGLQPHTPDFDELINLVTVNETYFFREEKQFDFLKNEVFPKYMGKNLTIWTCCCSTGEEPLSLLALALSMNVKLTIYASDIDDKALAHCKAGRYSLYSLRSDGKKYHELLSPYSSISENMITFNKDFINRIHFFKFNLIQDNLSMLPFFENVDILFMRNVFIYFDKETRRNVTDKVTQRLKQDGLLFFSMNEIGSIDQTVISHSLYKTNKDSVYYYVKDCSMKKKHQSLSQTRNLELQRKQKESEQKKAKLKLEIEKAKKQKSLERKNSADSLLSPALNKSSVSASEAEDNIKQIYENVCMEINRGNFEKARTLARAIPGSNAKKYSYFMLGYVEYHADNRSAAETFFASAESISPDFWPAFFYHGMVLRDMGRREGAQGCFSKCKKLISNFGSSVPYDFTLDSFSPSYIYSLCETFSVEGGA